MERVAGKSSARFVLVVIARPVQGCAEWGQQPVRLPTLPNHPTMLSTTCHCGAVTLTIPRAPSSLTNCNCSLCRRYGTLWAYYSAEEVTVSAAPGATAAYAWGPKTLQFVRCTGCGCVTHWEPIVPARGSRVGINARNVDPLMLGSVAIRRLDGAGTEQYID